MLNIKKGFNLIYLIVFLVKRKIVLNENKDVQRLGVLDMTQV